MLRAKGRMRIAATTGASCAWAGWLTRRSGERKDRYGRGTSRARL